MTPICRHCGKTEDEHCKFDSLVLPAGCKCPPYDWIVCVPPICGEYFNPTLWRGCVNCGHDEACHSKEITA